MEPEKTATGLPEGRFAGRQIFAQMVRNALACAARQGWRELILSDASFEDWPLGDRAVADSLQAWACAGRRLTMLAARFDEVQRRHPRFVHWRQRWGHIIECRVCHRREGADFPSLLWGEAWSLQRLDVVRQVIVCTSETSRQTALREWVDETLRGSTPGFPATVLGL
jgi:hypothetical protein